ncbi:MAG: hypothetical protein V1743_07075 [Nanoarchaeota archaeon]
MIYTPMVEIEYRAVPRTHRKFYRDMAKSHNAITIRWMKMTCNFEQKAETEYKKIASIDSKIRKYEDVRFKIYSQAFLSNYEEQDRYHAFPRLSQLEDDLNNLRQERIVHEELASLHQEAASRSENKMCHLPHLFSYMKVKFEYDGLVDRVRDYLRI